MTPASWIATVYLVCLALCVLYIVRNEATLKLRLEWLRLCHSFIESRIRCGYYERHPEEFDRDLGFSEVSAGSYDRTLFRPWVWSVRAMVGESAYRRITGASA